MLGTDGYRTPLAPSIFVGYEIYRNIAELESFVML